MSETHSEQRPATTDWPTFALRYTFNPAGVGLGRAFDPDEVVVFDATRGDLDDRWISAARGSYVAVEAIR